MVLGSVGTYSWSAITSTVKAAGAVVETAADIVVAHPILSVVAAIAGYEVFGGGSNNPSHLGQNIDTSA